MAEERSRERTERQRGRGKGRGGSGTRREDRRPGRRERDGSGASFRVLTELSAVEKALTKNDLVAQKQSLEAIARALRPLHLKSIDELDLNTRGRLITTLLRVQRQPKPPEPEGMPAEAKAEGQPAQVPAAEAPPAETEAPKAAEGQAEAPPPQAEAPAEKPEAAPAEERKAEAREGKAEEPKKAEGAPVDEKTLKFRAWQDVMFLCGQVWRAAGDEQRAAVAFAASGRKAEEVPAIEVPERTDDWQKQATALEKSGKTREAARLHEKHKSHAEAARLYEAAKDIRAALRCAVAAKDEEAARRLLKALKPEEARAVLEKAGAWELLMEHFIATKDFEGVARLYERARQFDQAALAWERAGKLSSARRAYERAKDFKSAQRVRELEVKKLIERGDRLGAALALMAAGDRARAVEVLSKLPTMKAFRFMQRAKLDEEALNLAKKELARAEQEGKSFEKARWLEMLGEYEKAAEAFVAADRKDRALAMYEQAGNWQRAAEMAEAVREYDKAIELFHRAGDKANAERVAALKTLPQETKPQRAEGEGVTALPPEGASTAPAPTEAR